MSPPSGISSTARASGDCAVIGVDDDVARGLRREAAARHNRIGVVPVALDRPVGGGRFVPCRPAHRRRPAIVADFADVPTPAGRPQLRRTPPAPGRPAAGCGVVARGDHPTACAAIPACRTARSGSRRSARSSSSTTARRPTPTPGARAVVLSATSTGSSAARRRRAASTPLAALLRPHPPRLPDRRGDRAVRRPARGQAAVRPLRRPAVGARRAHMRAPRPRRPRRRWCCCRRPAPRGTSGRATSIAAMHSAPWRARCRARETRGESGMIQVPRDDRSVIGQWWWTVDRWALGAVLRDHGVRRDADAGRLAAGGASASAPTPSCSPSASSSSCRWRWR